ncbi:MAG: DUF6600 domain-containing protein [Syntrophobacteraceae bacterium]
MKTHRKLTIGISLITMLAAWPMFLQGVCAGNGPRKVGLIGKVSAVDGRLMRYVPQTRDWVLTVKDTPFGLDDALASGADSRAEIVNPNNTFFRIGSDTVIHLIKLEDDFAEVDVSAGVMRCFNRSSYLLMKVTNPFGYVIVKPESVLDLYVGSESIEIFTLQGKAEYVSSGGESKYELSPGSPIITDGAQVAACDYVVDLQREAWDLERNSLMLTRLGIKGASPEILPQPLRSEAYSLEENGVWQEVFDPSCNCNRRLWRPTRVSRGWMPFTSGSWVEMYGENCWVPDEPFGYVTHHYGNWELVDGNWYWAPPKSEPTQPAVGGDADPAAPAIAEPAWYPGRVGWLSSGTEIGWFPLAPQEPFFSVNFWGPRADVIDPGQSDDSNWPDSAYSNDGGVAVEQDQFYSAENYSTKGMTPLNARSPGARNFSRMRTASANKSVASDSSRFGAIPPAGQPKPSQALTARVQQTKAGASESQGAVKSALSGIHTAKPAPSTTSTIKRPDSVTRAASHGLQMSSPGKTAGPGPNRSNPSPEASSLKAAKSSSKQENGRGNKSSASGNFRASSRSAGVRTEPRSSGSSARSARSGSSGSNVRSDSHGISGEKQARSDSSRTPSTQKMSRSGMIRNSSAHQGGRTGGTRAGANVTNAGAPRSRGAQKSALPRAGASRTSGGGKKR